MEMSSPVTFQVVDQIVVSVGPYTSISTPGWTSAPRSARARSVESASPPTSIASSLPSAARLAASATSSPASDGVHWKCVTPCAATVAAKAPALSSSAATITVKPRVRVHRSSSTEMSKDRLVTASQTPGRTFPARSPSTRSMPAKKFVTLRCSSITPFGVPVEPDV